MMAAVSIPVSIPESVHVEAVHVFFGLVRTVVRLGRFVPVNPVKNDSRGAHDVAVVSVIVVVVAVTVPVIVGVFMNDILEAASDGSPFVPCLRRWFLPVARPSRFHRARAPVVVVVVVPGVLFGLVSLGVGVGISRVVVPVVVVGALPNGGIPGSSAGPIVGCLVVAAGPIIAASPVGSLTRRVRISGGRGAAPVILISVVASRNLTGGSRGR